MPDLTDLYGIEVDFDADDLKPEPERWRIEADDAAQWALRRLAEAEQRIEDAKSFAAAEIARVEQWFDDSTRGAGRDVERFRAYLTDYMRHRHDADPKCKTVKLPAGTLTAKTPGVGKIDVSDLEALLAADKANPRALIRVKYEPDLNQIKAVLVAKDEGNAVEEMFDPESGEVVPGVSWVRPVTKFDAKTTAPEADES